MKKLLLFLSLALISRVHAEPLCDENWRKSWFYGCQDHNPGVGGLNHCVKMVNRICPNNIPYQYED